MAHPQAPLVLTLKLDPLSFERFNTLRQQHFPPERNFLPAHVTLFHALPGEEAGAIQHTLRELCTQTPCLPLTFSRWRHLGRGVAIELQCPPLVELRGDLAQLWHPWLSQQDRRDFKPHLTIQNKVTPEESRTLYNNLSQTWPLNQGETCLSGRGEGLLLWYYRGGPWELAGEFNFSQVAKGLPS